MKKTVYILITLIVLLLWVLNTNWYKFQEIQVGDNIIYIRDILGTPSKSSLYKQKYIIEVHHTSFNKYVFTYSLKDSLLISKWKEN